MPTTKNLILSIQNGEYDKVFSKLYCSSEKEIIMQQRTRYVETIEMFEKEYGKEREIKLYSAPGRTEIGGNHTDHNNGVVMAAAVNLDIIAVVSQNGSSFIKVTSKGFGKEDVIDINEITPQKQEAGHSASLIRGIAADIVNRGGKIGGFDAYTSSNVLRGSGLSSSAAFEVIIGAIFNEEFNNNKFTPVEIAQISQFAENVFFNKPSGLMDQTACSVGGAITIDFKNPKMPDVQKVEFNLSKYDFALCITDTKGSHADLTDDYAAIRQEMESVANVFGKKVLRDIDELEFINEISKIRAKCGDRAVLRAIHFFAECKRARNLCQAVREDKFDEFLAHIIAGGHSSFEYNQNAYSIKKPHEQGVAVGIAISQRVLNGKGAWRLQGGGFAGTIQAFVPAALLSEYCKSMNKIFGENSCYVLNVRNFGAICLQNII